MCKLGVVIESFKIVLDCFKIMLQSCTHLIDFGYIVNVLLLFCYGLTSIYVIIQNFDRFNLEILKIFNFSSDGS